MIGETDETPVSIPLPTFDDARPCPVCGGTPVDGDGDVCTICLDTSTRSADERHWFSGRFGSPSRKRRSRRAF